MKKRTLSLSIIVLLGLSGCVQMWTRFSEPTVTGPDNAFMVEVPTDWVRFSLMSDRLTFTRDGMGIQWIEVFHHRHENAFPKIKKSASPNLLPSELAELTIAELKHAPDLSSMVIEENMPAKVAGKPGFKLRIGFKSQSGVAYQREVYGAVLPKGVIWVSYQAISRRFWPLSYPTFERVRDTVKVTG